MAWAALGEVLCLADTWLWKRLQYSCMANEYAWSPWYVHLYHGSILMRSHSSANPLARELISLIQEMITHGWLQMARQQPRAVSALDSELVSCRSPRPPQVISVLRSTYEDIDFRTSYLTRVIPSWNPSVLFEIGTILFATRTCMTRHAVNNDKESSELSNRLVDSLRLNFPFLKPHVPYRSII